MILAKATCLDSCISNTIQKKFLRVKNFVDCSKLASVSRFCGFVIVEDSIEFYEG